MSAIEVSSIGDADNDVGSEIEVYVDPVGTPTWVNTTTYGQQSLSQTAALTGGGYVVVWQDTSSVANSGVPHDIRGQVFDGNGTKVGTEFLIDQSTAITRYPSVAATASGGFAVSWSDSVSGTRLRVFDQAGAALGNEVAVQDTLANPVNAVSMASMADGHYLVTWQERAPASGNTPAHNVVKAKIYGADNIALTGAFSLGPTDSTQQYQPTVGVVGDQFVVAWANTRPPSSASDTEVLAQRINANGVLLGDAFQVNTVTQGYQFVESVAGLADGSFVIAYGSDAPNGVENTVDIQRFDHAGNKLGGETVISGDIVGIEYGIRAVGLKDGNFIVGWTHAYTNNPASPDTPSDIYAREFLVDGTPIGSTVGYGTDPGGTNTPGDGLSLTVLGSGRLVSTWTDFRSQENYLQPNDRVGIRMQLADPLSLLFGTDQGETLTATAHSSAIEGRGGDDTLNGGAGNDQIDGGTGNDTIYGGGGNDTIYGSDGNDEVYGDAGDDTIAGGDGDDFISGGDGRDTLFGGAGNDTLIDVSQPSAPNVAPSQLDGGDGDDILSVYNGAFYLTGGDGNDRITVMASSGPTYIDAGGGSNVIRASGSGTLTIQASGDLGSDDITVQSGFSQVMIISAGQDVIRLTNNNNITIFLSQGHQVVVPGMTGGLMINGFVAGEAGDTLDLSGFGANPFAPGGPLTMTATGISITASGRSLLSGVDTRNLSSFNLGGVVNPNFNPQNMTLDGAFANNPGIDFPDELTAADGNDLLRGYGGNDTLYGAGGNDRLDGGLGADFMDGGTGNDTFVVNDPGDVVVERAGGGTDTVETALNNFVLGTTAGSVNVENLTLIGGALRGDGNDVDNVLTGNGLANTLFGYDGNDTLIGNGGIDALYGGAGNDRLIVGASGSGSFIDGGADTDTLAVTGAVSLGGLTGIEAIELQSGANLTLTGAQFNAIQLGATASGTGTITINLAPGDLQANAQFVTVAAGSTVNYLINGSSDSEVIKGGAGATYTIDGGDGSDQIRGGSLADIINGGEGNDKLIGANGADTLTGGAGSDVFRFQTLQSSGLGANADHITDFVSGVDRLGFALLDADPTTLPIDRFAYIDTQGFHASGAAEIRYETAGADLVVQLDANGDGVADMAIYLNGLGDTALASGDFQI